MEERSEEVASFAIVRAWTEAGPPRITKIRVLTSGGSDRSPQVIGVTDDIDQACTLVKSWLVGMPGGAQANVGGRAGVEDDLERLRTLNVAVGEAESRGDKAYFQALLAPAFAMRRSDGASSTDRASFIANVKPSAQRSTEIESIALLPRDRAIVTCVVTVRAPDGAKRFHNARMFTRTSSDQPWLLLAWANEPMP